MCGIAGIFSQEPVASELYDSIIHLQHRGQDAAGIMTYDERMHKEKGMGLAKKFLIKKTFVFFEVILVFRIIDILRMEDLAMERFSLFGLPYHMELL